MKCTVLFFCWFIIQWQVFPIPYLLNEHSISHHSSDVKRFPRQLSLSNTNQNCQMTSGLSLKLKQAVISYTKPRISKYSLVGLLFALRANDRQSKVISNKLILGFFFRGTQHSSAKFDLCYEYFIFICTHLYARETNWHKILINALKT